MAIGVPVLLTDGADGADLNQYSTASVTPVSTSATFLHVANGDTAVATAGPTAVSGLGLTWTLVDEIGQTNNNNAYTTVWKGIGSPTPGAVSIDFADTQQNCLWSLLQVPGVDLDGPVVQSEAAFGAVTNVTATLASAITPGNAVITFSHIASGTAGIVVTNAGYTSLGNFPFTGTPSVQIRWAYNLSPGENAITWQSQTSGVGAAWPHTNISIELAASTEGVADTWTYRKFARFGT